MAKAPIMPVFTDALIGDTTHLSTEQFGAYVLILLATWRNNGRALPDDDARMARLCRAGVQRWRSKLRPSLVEFFDISDGLWHQHRLEKEWERVAGLIAKRRASASAGGRATAARNAATDGARKDNLEDSEELFDRPESLNAARAKEKKSCNVNPEGGRCAPLGDNLAVQPEWDTPKTRMPARLADRHRDGECDAVPSQAPASDYRLGPGEAATGGRVAAPFLPPNQRDLDPEGQNHDNPRQEPGMGSSHAVSPGLAASRTALGAVAMLGPGPCPRTGKSPALKAKIRDQLVSKCARFLVNRKRPAEVAAYWAAMLGDDAAEAQRMLDATDGRMRRAGWDDMRQWKAQHGIAA
jgi:uncharacterized protein YdaU (DUF1376 family)